MAELLVGIDIGTTMTKAAVVGTDGRELSWGRAPTPWREVPTGAEAAPEDLFGAVCQATAAALAASPPGRVVGVGVTSLAESVVQLTSQGELAGPCIVWYDRRGAEEAADAARVFGLEAFARRTGLSPAPIRTLMKLAWLARHGHCQPARALSIADWVVHRMGGEQRAEASLASRTGALSLAGPSWWEEGLAWAGAKPGLFPPVVSAGHASGHVALHLVQDGGRDMGRLAGAALTSAGHDHLCAACGTGAIRADQVLDSCGTAEALVRTVAPMGEEALADASAEGLEVSRHTVPGCYALLRGHQLGFVLDRVLRLLGADRPEALSALEAAAAATGAGALRLVLGEPFGAASIVGLQADASPAGLWNAALDAVAAGAAEVVEAMGRVAGPAEELVLSGGWARSAGLRRRKAALLPRARWPEVTEAGARGAALFGGMAAGLFQGPAEFPPPGDRPL